MSYTAGNTIKIWIGNFEETSSAFKINRLKEKKTFLFT